MQLIETGFDGCTWDGVAARADEAVEAGEIDNEAIPVVLVKGALLEEILNECGFQRTVCLFLCRVG